MFERATLSLGTMSVTLKVALCAGSSQHGRALLASAAYWISNTVICRLIINTDTLQTE